MRKSKREVEFFDHQEIEVCLHDLGLAILKSEANDYHIKFNRLKDCFHRHFLSEENTLHFDDNISFVHQKEHELFGNELNRYLGVLDESISMRIQVLAEIQHWLIAHSKKFDEPICEFEI